MPTYRATTLWTEARVPQVGDVAEPQSGPELSERHDPRRCRRVLMAPAPGARRWPLQLIAEGLPPESGRPARVGAVERHLERRYHGGSFLCGPASATGKLSPDRGTLAGGRHSAGGNCSTTFGDPRMTGDALDGLVVRQPTADDHGRVLAVMDHWWDGLGGPEGVAWRASALPRLFFQHFSDTSFLLERDG